MMIDMSLRRAACVVWLAACDLALPIYETSDASQGADVTVNDASNGDASNGDASDGGLSDVVDAGFVNLVINPEFVSGTACGVPWDTTNHSSTVQLTRVDGSAPGEQACLVCSTTKGFGITESVSFADAAPSSFQLGLGGHIWAAPPDDSVRVEIVADVHFVDGGRVFVSVPSPDQFDAGGMLVDPTAAANQQGFTNQALAMINFSVNEDDVDGGCFVVEAPVMIVVK
jgi:hypothetical protein